MLTCFKNKRQNYIFWISLLILNFGYMGWSLYYIISNYSTATSNLNQNNISNAETSLSLTNCYNNLTSLNISNTDLSLILTNCYNNLTLLNISNTDLLTNLTDCYNTIDKKIKEELLLNLTNCNSTLKIFTNNTKLYFSSNTNIADLSSNLTYCYNTVQTLFNNFSSIQINNIFSIISLPDYGNPVQSYVYYINKLDNIFSNDICNYNELKNLYIYTRNIVNCNNQFTIEVSRLIIQDATNIGAIFCNTCNCDLISKFVDLKYWYCMYRIL